MRRTCGRRIGDGVAREGRGRGGPCLVRSPLKTTVGWGRGSRALSRRRWGVQAVRPYIDGSATTTAMSPGAAPASRGVRRGRVFGQPPQEIWQHRLLTRPRRPRATIGRRSRDIRTRHPRPPGPLHPHAALGPPAASASVREKRESGGRWGEKECED